MKITSETQSRTLLIGGGIAALIVGVVGGYFAAHLGMADMPGMQGKSMKDMPVKEGDMKSMPTSPPGTIVIPAVTRQLIGVRTAPVSRNDNSPRRRGGHALHVSFLHRH